MFKGDNDIKKHYINGGPNCFGDSGGPLWRTVEAESKLENESTKKKKVPVLIGVFSFLLWGTCHGAQVSLIYCISLYLVNMNYGYNNESFNIH